MLPINDYGKLTPEELNEELAQVTATLASRIRELGGLKQDINNEYWPSYWRAPGNSVKAKENEAEYQSLHLRNEESICEADILALTAQRDCLVTIINAA